MITPLKKHEWYALRVKSNREKLVAMCLRHKEYEAFLPLYESKTRWSDRTKDLARPLIPGYVFCRMNPVHRLAALTIPGAVCFVGIGKTPAPIDESEIIALQVIVQSGAAVKPWPFLEAGHRVRIAKGPLRGVEGIVTDLKDGMHIVVSIGLLQRSVAVEIDSDSVIPVASATKDPYFPDHGSKSNEGLLA